MHGLLARNKGGYTAHGELERTNMSGISGHTHRSSQVYRTTYAGTLSWTEAGCLCDIDNFRKFEYLHGRKPDWQQSIVIGTYLVNGQDTRFILSIVPIFRHKLLWNGKLYTP